MVCIVINIVSRHLPACIFGTNKVSIIDITNKPISVMVLYPMVDTPTSTVNCE